MSKQTLPESTKKAKEAPARNAQPARPAKGRLYRRQTARVEERRDGKPLLFGWGKHLSRRQKNRIQTRAFWAFAMVAILAVVGVLGYSYYYNNYYVPGEPIVTVNGHIIPQSLFRKMNFYISQSLSNQAAALTQEQNAAQQLANSTDPTKQQQGQQALAALQNQLQTLKANYTIAAVGTQSVQNLTDDELIREQIPTLETHGVPAAKLEASDKEITDALNAFKKSFPATTPYQQFLSSGKLSEDDVRQLIAITIRQNKMDQYQQSLIGSTVAQVHSNDIEANSQTEANQFLSELKSNSDLPTAFAKLAKRSSHDANTKTKGGDMGWVVYGDTTTNADVERWLFNPARKLGDLSPAISIGGGQYEILYISAIDPHRPVSADKLSSLKSEAYTHWESQTKTLPQTTITDIDSAKQQATSNFPSNLPASAPSPTTGQVDPKGVSGIS